MLPPNFDELSQAADRAKRLAFEETQQKEALERLVLEEPNETDLSALMAVRREEVRRREFGGLKGDYVDALVEKRVERDAEGTVLGEMVAVHHKEKKPTVTTETVTTAPVTTDLLANGDTIDQTLIANGLAEYANRIFDTDPVAMAKKAQDYFVQSENDGSPYTFTGMLLAMGFSCPEEWNDYERVVGFSRIMKVAKTKCAHYIEKGILMGTISPAVGGLILKSVHNWRENVVVHNLHTTENNSRITIDVDVADALQGQLRALLSNDEETEVVEVK